MKGLKYFFYLLLVILLFLPKSLLAQPVFQVYSPDSCFAGDYGPDQHTWFVDSNSFELWIIGAYYDSDSTDGLYNVRLFLSVPNGETGSIMVTGLPGSGTNDPTFISYYTDTSFFPTDFDNHYPLHEENSDFIVYDIDPFFDVGDPIYDYNPKNGGTITLTNGRDTGQVKEYMVTVSGYTSMHLDVYGLDWILSYPCNKYVWKNSWWDSDSHDTTYISVLKKMLNLLEPNEGDVLTAGSIYPIKWSSNGTISDVLIEYSVDNGLSWLGVDPPNLGNSGLYNWLVPAVDSNQCLVRVSYVNDPNISNTIGDVFTITSLVSIVPDTAHWGESLSITIDGNNTHFLHGACITRIWFSQGGSTIDASSYSALSDTLVDTNFDIPYYTTVGSWNVHIEGRSQEGYDPSWLRNAVEEPLDEANIDVM